MEDDLVFADENELAVQATAPPWVLLVVDDDPGVHDVTLLILKSFTFEGRSLEFLNAYSALEAEQIMAARDDIALVLLDVVMETETAGLDLADRIRFNLNNHQARIILRTGQAAILSETEAIRRYDVNGYLQKIDLTLQKLQIACLLALRDYRDILASYRT